MSARRMIQHSSTKTYTHEEGLSCCFRQWRAESHCHFLHGYAIQVSMEFRCTTLDKNNWVVDFGSLKPIKQWLKDNFDHILLIAEDDPMIGTLSELETAGLAQIRVVKNIGMEAFAEEIFCHVALWVESMHGDRVGLYKVEVREHGGNSAIARNTRLPI